MGAISRRKLGWGLALLGLIILARTFRIEAGDFRSLKAAMTPAQEQEFLREDQAYLEGLGDRQVLKGEIRQLELELEDLAGDYDRSQEGIRVYTGNTGLRNNALRTALVNRRAFLRGAKTYKSQARYTINRDYRQERKSLGYFSQRDMDLVHRLALEVLDNIDLDLGFLRGTCLVISPYRLEGVNGYAVSRTDGRNTIVLSIYKEDPNQALDQDQVRATILHELGHIFFNSHRREMEDKAWARTYFTGGDKKLANREEAWKASRSENFAEDFRLYFSPRLGAYSFQPSRKKTQLSYREEGFGQLILELDKKIQLPRGR